MSPLRAFRRSSKAGLASYHARRLDKNREYQEKNETEGNNPRFSFAKVKPPRLLGQPLQPMQKPVKEHRIQKR